MIHSKHGTEMADIVVGAKKVLFRVPKRKLLGIVPCFATLLDDTNTSKLPDIHEGDFDLLMDFVATDGYSMRDFHDYDNFVWDPVTFFALAEKLELPALQDLIIDKLVLTSEEYTELCDLEFARRAYKYTRAGSKLSKYALFVSCYRMQRKKARGELPPGSEAKLVELLQNSNCAADFLDFMKNGLGEVKHPREINYWDFFYSGKRPERVLPSSEESSLRSETPPSRRSRKKRILDDQPQSAAKKVKQTSNESEAILADHDTDVARIKQGRLPTETRS